MEKIHKIKDKKENIEEKEVVAHENTEQIKLYKMKKEDINAYFKKTLKNTLSAFFLSLIYTVINFACNIPLLRSVSKDSYAIVKVHLELAFTLINFLPRETVRRASQKFCPDKDPEKEREKYFAISQMNYIFFFLVSIASIFIFFSFMLFTDSKRLHENYIQLLIYIICGVLELIIEPVIMYMNLHMENKFFPITISSITRVVTNTIFVVFFDMDLWGFTLSRIIGTTVYISYIFFLGLFKYKLNFYNYIPTNYKTLICGKETNNGINILYLREVIYQFIKLNLLNLILSRCQNMVLSFVMKNSDEDKSDYSFIYQNYNLISRFLLEPIIDAFYNLVNKIKHIEKKKEEYMKTADESKDKENENTTNDINPESKDEPAKSSEVKEEENTKNEREIIKSYLKEPKKEINYEITIKLLQLFLKIFTCIGILIIPYYILIGTEVMGLIYGQKWYTNAIDKIGDCYSYYIIFIGVSDLIKNFSNATNNSHQMNLSYISLIINAVFLTIIMSILSKWDICGLIITNELSGIFLINMNLYIIFCGRKEKKNYNALLSNSLYFDIDQFIKKCFISKTSMFITFICLVVGHILKKSILVNYGVVVKILGTCAVGLVNVWFLYTLEFTNFIKDLNAIKSYE